MYIYIYIYGWYHNGPAMLVEDMASANFYCSTGMPRHLSPASRPLASSPVGTNLEGTEGPFLSQHAAACMGLLTAPESGAPRFQLLNLASSSAVLRTGAALL